MIVPGATIETMMLPILLSPSLRAMEYRHAKVKPPLMERAGQAAAEIALEMLAGQTGEPLILAGPGNNGGDAFVVARHLRAAGLSPRVLFAGDVAKLPPDAAQAYRDWLASGGTLISSYPKGRPGLIVDGLFGIGMRPDRPITGKAAKWIDRSQRSEAPILALDVPSGLDADTGMARGLVIRATHTATFIALKPGMLMNAGPDFCGKISLCDLDLSISKPDGQTVAPEHFHACLHPRPRNSHKGSFGSSAIIGGAPGMVGAALLAGRAALKLGSGRVYLGLIESLPVDIDQPELMLRTADAALQFATAIAIGPGLGQSELALQHLAAAIANPTPLVMDADALNLLASRPDLKRQIIHRARMSAVLPTPTFLTPHPAEAARLLSTTTDAIQADRIGAACTLAKAYRAHVALKGCGTVLAFPNGHWFINTTGNPGLATAGSGDVLTGILTALLAQGWPADQALLGAVHLHGAAADAAVEEQRGPTGLTAGELINPARRLLNIWSSNS